MYIFQQLNLVMKSCRLFIECRIWKSSHYLFGVRGRTSFIDGTYLDNCIFSQMSHLHSFTFDIITDFVRSIGHIEPSVDDIRRTFIQRGRHVDCYIDYHHITICNDVMYIRYH